ncbi:hypothetical protein PYW08_007192 [Mythimna loreyi]|uniref:Uncharacterized protein n=1 Tax=Mythimna loreyi TaxID=667449 RepID=A0ACC2RB10_9NEOP|nr:hypothetical protein PYW08_007192 [Mythimna loreyi]
MFDDCNRLQLRCVNNTIKIHLLSYYNLFIPDLARICEHHLRTTSLEDFTLLITRRHSDINSGGIYDIVRLYTAALEKKHTLNFEDMSEITEDNLHFWTGLNHTQFNHLISQIPSLRQLSSSPQLDLGVYLSKIRTGEPSVRLGTTFDLSRQSVDRKIHFVRNCMLNDFVPLHLGFDHISRSEAINRNRLIPQHIFGNTNAPKVIAVLDGTYLFVEKSSNFLFQRLSYSLHKYKNLIKPFMIVCTDGYILDVTGPYNAKTTDAEIMHQILHNHGEPIEDNSFHYFFEHDDIFILDRGFRDAIPEIELHGYNAHMPPTKSRNETQLSTEDANQSRLVTMCRWVVEAINGRFKRDYKIFRHRIFNRALPHIFEDFKIAAALINCYQEPYEDSPYTNDFVQIINENIHKPNRLADYVLEHNINRQRVSFERLDADDPQLSDFSRLSLEDLIRFSVGTYHVKMARSYCSEHLRGTNVFIIERYRHSQQIFEDSNDVLIRCMVNSRHRARTKYYTYVLYNTVLQGRQAIKEHYCSCLHGRRTLGSCTHVISILYFLGCARHEEVFRHPASFLDSILIDPH